MHKIIIIKFLLMEINDFRSAIDKMNEPERSKEIAQLTDEDFLECNLTYDLAFNSVDVIELLTIIEREHKVTLPGMMVFYLTDKRRSIRKMLEEINRNL